MGKASRDKGQRGERELAAALTGHGYDCRRTCQTDGRIEPDLIGLPGIHIECKRVEKLNIHDALAQAIHDAQSGKLPAVFSRRNHSPWLVTIRLDDFVRVYREWEAGGCP